MDKVAVDAAAKNYWSTYLKEFGEMWVRDIPRRIKQAIRREFKANEIEGSVAPLAREISEDKTLSVEAAFVGKIDDRAAKVLVTATFNPEGRMEGLDITRIS